MSSADWIILAAYVVVAGLAGLLGYLIVLWITDGRGIGRSLVAGLVVSLAACAIGLVAWSPPRAEVQIDTPAEAVIVRDRLLLIEGAVSPPDATVHILVHPSSVYDEPWWVQPAPVQQDGEWDATIRLGKLKDGEGQYFQIVAVASPRPTLFDLLHHQRLEQGQKLTELPALPRSEIVTVWREQ